MTSRKIVLLPIAVLYLLVFYTSAFAQSYTALYYDAVGSWFGRAIPKSGATICDPFDPKQSPCPVPKEIVMAFTFQLGGTFIGIDSNIFAGGSHSTAHGEWNGVWPNRIDATFTLLQSAPNGVFIGGFKNLFDATLVDRNSMEGQIDAYLYSYTDPATGVVHTDAEGFPTPSPLDPPALCDPGKGCLHMGIFTFKARRMTVQ